MELGGLLAGLDETWVGLSLTMPLKRAVLPLLDEVEPLALEVGAANTVLLSGGRRRGANTDVPGLVATVREVLAGRAAAGRSARSPLTTATVLGGGATAASTLAALAQLGVGDVRAVVRSAARADVLPVLAHRLGLRLTLVGWDEALPALDADLVVATAPAGAADGLAGDLDAAVARGELPWGPVGVPVLVDVVYAPWPTPLAYAWDRAGGPVASGLLLLLHQAALQVELMTGRPAPLAAMRAAGEAALDTRAVDDASA